MTTKRGGFSTELEDLKALSKAVARNNSNNERSQAAAVD